MNTETLVATRDIVAGVRAAFHGAGECHCHTVPKLGADDLLNGLVRQGVISLADVCGVNAITIEVLDRHERHGGHPSGRFVDERGRAWPRDGNPQKICERT